MVQPINTYLTATTALHPSSYPSYHPIQQPINAGIGQVGHLENHLTLPQLNLYHQLSQISVSPNNLAISYPTSDILLIPRASFIAWLQLFERFL